MSKEETTGSNSEDSSIRSSQGNCRPIFALGKNDTIKYMHDFQRTNKIANSAFEDDEFDLVQKALYALGPPIDVLASLNADSVQRASMQMLQPGWWINNEIINYFLKKCLAKRDKSLCAKQPGRKRKYFFNSYFVQTMFDNKNSNLAKRGKYNYNNVERWSKKVPGKDIFGLKYVVCLINLDNMHWTSAMIFVEERKIQYYDSMGGMEWTKLEGLLQYLKDEHKAKKGKELEG